MRALVQIPDPHKKVGVRAGGMAQQLNAFLALAEHPSSVPSTHIEASQPSIMPVPGDPMASSDSYEHKVHTWCTYIHEGKTFKNIK